MLVPEYPFRIVKLALECDYFSRKYSQDVFILSAILCQNAASCCTP